jgi:DNA polymerase III epsilon subunit-like protein
MKILFIDTETGGTESPEEHSTLSLGCAAWEDGKIIGTKEFFILWPVLKITAGALRVNKIKMLDFIEKAKSPEIVKKEFFSFVFDNFGTKYPIVLGGHNTHFDAIRLKHLIGNRRYNRMFSYRMRDTGSTLAYLQDIGVYPKENSISLVNACAYHGIIIRESGEHGALEDALATAKLYTKLIEVGGTRLQENRISIKDSVMIEVKEHDK